MSRKVHENWKLATPIMSYSGPGLKRLQRELEYTRITGSLYPPEIVTGQSDEGGLLCIGHCGVTGGVPKQYSCQGTTLEVEKR